MFQDGAAAVAPAPSLGLGPEREAAAGFTGLQRELHPTDGHPPGLQPRPEPGLSSNTYINPHKDTTHCITCISTFTTNVVLRQIKCYYVLIIPQWIYEPAPNRSDSGLPTCLNYYL